MLDFGRAAKAPGVAAPRQRAAFFDFPEIHGGLPTAATMKERF
jgi:hypothetical protein